MSASAFPYGAVAASGGGSSTFGLTGTPETISSEDESGFNVTANFYVDNDGDLRKRQEVAGIFTTSTFGDYNNGGASDPGFGDGYHVRLTHATGANTYQSGSGLGTWLALTSDRSWQFQVANSGPNTESGTYTCAFSDDGGSTTLDSFTLTVSLENRSP